MAVPQLMMKEWDGSAGERFTWRDMNRVGYNANIMAGALGITPVQFIQASRADIFRYDEARKLETLTRTLGTAAGLTLTTDSAWAVGRSVSYVDFERWESNLYAIYQALGGYGDRIPSDKRILTYHAVIGKDDWQGSGPYHCDLTFPSVHTTSDSIVYVDHIATVEQRYAELSAVMHAVTQGDRLVRVYALGKRPICDIPIKLTTRAMKNMETITLASGSWQGSGPWTQTVTLQHSVEDAVIGPCDASTNAMATEIARCGISVSALSGTSMTVRAILNCPTVSLTMGVWYNEDDIE